MKHVAKGGAPRELINWKNENKATPENIVYGGGGFPNEAVKLALLHEQGWICGYTMVALASDQACHIEHILPRSIYPELQTEFHNLLACHPANGGDTSIGFGAPLKGNKDVSKNNFVFPADASCERRFCFSQDGGVRGHGGDGAAANTIEILKLNNDNLKQKRLAAIGARGLTNRPAREGRPRRKLATAREARQLADSVLRRNAFGRHEEFCVALHQVASAYAEKEERRAGRLKGGARS